MNRSLLVALAIVVAFVGIGYTQTQPPPKVFDSTSFTVPVTMPTETETGGPLSVLGEARVYSIDYADSDIRALVGVLANPGVGERVTIPVTVATVGFHQLIAVATITATSPSGTSIQLEGCPTEFYQEVFVGERPGCAVW